MAKFRFRRTNSTKKPPSEFSKLLRQWRNARRLSYETLGEKSGLAASTVTNGSYARFRPFGRPRAESLATALDLTGSQREAFLAAYDELPLSPSQQEAREKNKASVARNAERAAYTARGIMIALERKFPGAEWLPEVLDLLGANGWRAELQSPLPTSGHRPIDITLMEVSHPVPPRVDSGNGTARIPPPQFQSLADIHPEDHARRKVLCWWCNDVVDSFPTHICRFTSGAEATAELAELDAEEAAERAALGLSTPCGELVGSDDFG